MRICYLADARSLHVRRWAGYFAGRGHQVHIITGWPGEGYGGGVRLHLLSSLLPQTWRGSGYINWLAWLLQIRRLIKRIKPDIVDAHYITVYGYLGALAGCHPLVLTAWGSDVLMVMRDSPCLRALGRYALRRAELITGNSETLKREMVRFGAGPERIEIVRQGVDTRRFRPGQGEELKGRLGLAGRPVVISTRNFQPVYNLAMLVRAIPLVLARSPQAVFLFVGGGEQRAYLEELAGALGCPDNVRFVGRVEHDELARYLALADVYVSTSLSDSASLSLQEAMACALAPVITDLEGNREWVTDGQNGFLVPVNDVPALAERIVYLLENGEIRQKFGQRGRQIVQERAEYEQEMARMEGLYQRLLARG